jgi:hypothetical protein
MKTFKRVAFACFVLTLAVAFRVRLHAYETSGLCYELGAGYYRCTTVIRDVFSESEVSEICAQADAYCWPGPGDTVGVISCEYLDYPHVAVSCVNYHARPPGCEDTGCPSGYWCVAGGCEQLP